MAAAVLAANLTTGRLAALIGARAVILTGLAGAVSRFATSASITSPCEIGATCRTGHS
jgi:hypothetical protein